MGAVSFHVGGKKTKRLVIERKSYGKELPLLSFVQRMT